MTAAVRTATAFAETFFMPYEAAVASLTEAWIETPG